VVRRLNASAEYRRLFGRAFADVRGGAPVAFDHVARALAEFQFTQTYADAPLDRYARGQRGALGAAEKRGAVLFFGRAGCVACHAVSGRSGEMFSDFREHVVGVPQVAPASANVAFDGPGGDEDFGLEQATGDPADRYAFRTAPLRNVALQPAFMHNGRVRPARGRDPAPPRTRPRRRAPGRPRRSRRTCGAAGSGRTGARATGPAAAPAAPLTDAEVADLVAFVGTGLLDARRAPGAAPAAHPRAAAQRAVPFAFQFP
jgi:cytochrome c peroxidase